MTETLTELPNRLPEFNGDLGFWNADVGVLERALLSPDGLEFTARLPEVIGRLTDKEVATFSDFDGVPIDTTFLPRGIAGDATYKLRELFPTSAEIILEDMDRVSKGTARVGELDLDKKVTEAGKVARGETSSLHVDFAEELGDIYLPRYLIASSNPTEFYQGPANFKSRDSLKLPNC